MKQLMPVAILLVLCASSVTAYATTPAHHTKNAHNSSLMHPKLTLDSALAIAKAQVPHGTVKSHELEREHGRLIYSFDFVVAGKSGIDEVNVDAMTGAVVATEHEAPKAERQEQMKEKGEAKATVTGH